MSLFSSKLPTGARRLFRLPLSRARLLRDMDQEVQFHVAMRIAELRQRGMSEAEAQAEALRRFGDTDEFRAYAKRRAARQAHWLGAVEWVRELTRDIRFAGRQFRKSPGFTMLAVLTLALAIGASTAAFSLVNGVLLKPLGFERPDRLVYLHGTGPQGAATMISPQDLIDFRNQTHSFASIVAVQSGQNLNLLRPNGPPLRVNAARVGAQFFSLLGTRAQLGRTFAPGEDARTATKVVVLSDGAWRHYFGADPGIVGAQITLDGNPYVVVGVAPPWFNFPDNAELWYPAVWEGWEVGDVGRGNHSIDAIAKLRDGATLESAQRDLSSVATRIAQAFPKDDAGVGVAAVPLRQLIVGEVEAPLWAMLGAVMFVLLIACANVANLLLVRAASRAPEMAVRTALGAGRHQILRQSLAESMLIALGGAVLGTLLAVLVVHVLTAGGTLALPRT